MAYWPHQAPSSLMYSKLLSQFQAAVKRKGIRKLSIWRLTVEQYYTQRNKVQEMHEMFNNSVYLILIYRKKKSVLNIMSPEIILAVFDSTSFGEWWIEQTIPIVQSDWQHLLWASLALTASMLYFFNQKYIFYRKS